ncbi:MAG: hypothetical protein N3C61_00365 [Candidatus Micrarchaeota archaeon]|nr:hypothetical protein [Candidatus Micrarchaeota archaeon]
MIQDLPFKIRTQGKMAIPSQVSMSGNVFRSVRGQGMWGYNTISKDVKISMCPGMYFYGEDIYSLSSVPESKRTLYMYLLHYLI